MDWEPIVATLIGIGFGSALGLGSTLLTSRQAETRDTARRAQDKLDAHAEWKRDRLVEALERAFGAIGTLVASNHPNHEQWKAELAYSNLVIRLYGDELLQGAFSSVKDGMVFAADHYQQIDQRAMVLLGEATSYLQTAARCELGIGGTRSDVEAARAKFLSRADDMRVLDID